MKVLLAKLPQGTSKKYTLLPSLARLLLLPPATPLLPAALTTLLRPAAPSPAALAARVVRAV
jgi:hypothetical protein